MLISIASAAACGSSDEADDPTNVSDESSNSTHSAAPSESTSSGTASVEAFCAEYATLQGERPESYVGSAEHRADIEGLLAVSPSEVAGNVATFGDYVASGAINSEADPNSNLAENWPTDVQAAIANIQSYATENCLATELNCASPGRATAESTPRDTMAVCRQQVGLPTTRSRQH